MWPSFTRVWLSLTKGNRGWRSVAKSYTETMGEGRGLASEEETMGERRGQASEEETIGRDMA